MSGPQIEQGIQKIYEWLEPGGKVFVVVETPDKQMFKRFIPYYESRKNLGEKWPGEISDITDFVDSRMNQLPKFMNLLEEDIIKRAFESTGFYIEKSQTFSKPFIPLDATMDGRESAGLIAIKK